MSKIKSLITQTRIDTAIEKKIEAKRRQRQIKCHHKLLVVRHFDFDNDRVYYSAICERCGYVEE